MRTLNPILAAGLAGGYGEPIVRLKRYNRASPLTLHDTLNVVKYEMTRFACTIWTDSTVSYDAYLVPSIHILERGLKINGVEYTVQSPYFYFTSYQVTGDAWNIGLGQKPSLQKISLSAWDSTTNYDKSTAADVSAATVIGNLLSYGCSASFSSNEEWHTWQWEKAGTTLHLSDFNGLLPMLWNKYTAKMFPRDNGTIVFKTLTAAAGTYPPEYPYDSMQATTIINDSPEINPARWNILWEDETGATHRLSAIYSELIGKPLRNIGFLPSTADTLEVLNVTIQQTELGLGKIITPINLQIEQGEHLMPVGNVYIPSIYATVTESYNMGTRYAWQTEINGERMWYNAKGM